LEDFHLDIVIPHEIGLNLEINEHGSTYKENASLKAMGFAHASGVVSLADDSGLEVDALGGLPGVRSARFSPLPNATDADRGVFIKALKAYPPTLGSFSLYSGNCTPDSRLNYAEGNCPGQLIPSAQQNGFGYDPFLLPETGLTMAELDMSDKNRLSHRAQAVKAAVPILLDILQPGK
jgi:XTP/dITP diphosphohydrolase